MSNTHIYTFYLLQSTSVRFPILNVSLPAPQSQKFSQTQYTVQIQSTPDASTALGLGTASDVITIIVDQQGQYNFISNNLLNMNGEANGQTGGDIPPKGVLALTSSILADWNQSNPGPVKAVVNTSLCSGAYFGATGVAVITHIDTDPSVGVTEYKVTCTLPDDSNPLLDLDQS